MNRKDKTISEKFRWSWQILIIVLFIILMITAVGYVDKKHGC